MKKVTLFLALMSGLCLHAQIQQNIFTASEITSNPLSDIDSIRFNTAGEEMHLVLKNGNVKSHVLSTIDSITFTSPPNPLAHSCGADKVHNPALSYGSMTDQAGNVYKTIVIGTQEWMAENLKTTVYSNGETIPNVTNNSQWEKLTNGAWSYYLHDSLFECPYGKLYNWYAVSDTRNVCPIGWHVPTDEEWTTLENYLGGSAVWQGKLKSIGTTYWQVPNSGATNESGFSGLPGGFRIGSGNFSATKQIGSWWSATENNSYKKSAWTRGLGYYVNQISRGFSDKEIGLSIRCIKN